MKTFQGVADPLGDPKDGHILTRAIIDTIREPLIILDEKLCIITASRSFYDKFHLTHANTRNKSFSELGNGEWAIPALNVLLKQVIPGHTTIEGYEVEHVFKSLGLRIMLINAREIRYENGRKKMLLSIFDVTEQRALESDRENLIIQKDLLLQEMRHRIANSLQLIASILILKAGMVKSEETRLHLEDAHSRIMTVATVQEQLDPSVLEGAKIKVGEYLTVLSASLAKSMIGGRKSIKLEVKAGPGTTSSEEAISLGLMTTELVINSLKHAFPDGRKGKVQVTYKAHGLSWALGVSDDGVGFPKKKGKEQTGLGTGIVSALAAQMKAEIRTESGPRGTIVSIIHNLEKQGKG